MDIKYNTASIDNDSIFIFLFPFSFFFSRYVLVLVDRLDRSARGGGVTPHQADLGLAGTWGGTSP